LKRINYFNMSIPPSVTGKEPYLPGAPLEPSLICELTRIATARGAINLGEGMPDAPPPEAVCSALEMALRESDIRQLYQSENTWGQQRLRQAVANYTHRFYGLHYNPQTEITITCGATEGLYLALQAIIAPGDEILLLEPFYESYPYMIRALGGTPVFVSLEVHPTWPDVLNAMEQAITPRTRAMILTNPDNPTGTVRTREELESLAHLLQTHGLWCLSDEVYDQYTYLPHKPFIPMASLSGMQARTMSFGTASKLLQATGWRVGWMLGPAPWMERVRAAHELTTAGTASLMQHATAYAVEAFDSIAAQTLKTEYAKKRQQAFAILQALGLPAKQAKGALPDGGWFCWWDGATPFGIQDAMPWLFDLIKNRGITLVSGASFCRNRQATTLRLCFAKQDTTLLNALHACTRDN
jgi:aspartate/methionine/tyrosine aminotransferase